MPAKNKTAQLQRKTAWCRWQTRGRQALASDCPFPIPMRPPHQQHQTAARLSRGMIPAPTVCERKIKRTMAGKVELCSARSPPAAARRQQPCPEKGFLEFRWPEAMLPLSRTRLSAGGDFIEARRAKPVRNKRRPWVTCRRRDSRLSRAPILQPRSWLPLLPTYRLGKMWNWLTTLERQEIWQKPRRSCQNPAAAHWRGVLPISMSPASWPTMARWRSMICRPPAAGHPAKATG